LEFKLITKIIYIKSNLILSYIDKRGDKMAEREMEKREQSEEETKEIWAGEETAPSSAIAKKHPEEEKGKTPRVDVNVGPPEMKAVINPPEGGGKILKDAVGARGHNPGYDTGKNYSMDTVKKAVEVVNKGQERPEVKWPKD
jgi:hypothetical protein